VTRNHNKPQTGADIPSIGHLQAYDCLEVILHPTRLFWGTDYEQFDGIYWHGKSPGLLSTSPIGYRHRYTIQTVVFELCDGDTKITTSIGSTVGSSSSTFLRIDSGQQAQRRGRLAHTVSLDISGVGSGTIMSGGEEVSGN
jgi:hypothetical protein